MIVFALAAFTTRSYRILSAGYAVAPETGVGTAPASDGAGGMDAAPAPVPPTSAAQARGGVAEQ